MYHSPSDESKSCLLESLVCPSLTRLSSSGTFQPKRGANGPGRRGGAGRVTAGAQGSPLHHAHSGWTDHGCVQPE